MTALGFYGLLFLLVLLHEFGHCYGCRRTGGEATEILLWPLGGLASVNPTPEPRAHMVTTLAGPAVNVVLGTLTAVVLVIWLGGLGAVPINPLSTLPVDSSLWGEMNTAQVWTARFFSLNYMLVLFNLLPIFPFDGGRVLQVALWPRKGYEQSLLIATGVGMAGAVALGLFGLFSGASSLLLMLAVFGYFTCWQTRQQVRMGDPGLEASYGRSPYAESLGLDDESRRPPGFFERRREAKAQRQAERAQQAELERREAVDAVLRKVSTHGIESLTPRERRTLEQETHRQQTTSARGE